MKIEFSNGQGDIRLVGSTVKEDLFGANFLFDRDSLDVTNAGVGGAAYLNAISTLDLRQLRYPGGTIAEDLLDLRNPDASMQDGQAVVPLVDFMSFCGRNDISATIVIPTIRYLSNQRDGSGNRIADVDEAEVRAFVMRTLEYAKRFGTEVDGFEIGNEWYYRNVSATEYGRVASEIAKIVDDTIEEFNDRSRQDVDLNPDVIIQLGYQSQADRETVEIFRQFNDDELRSVSGLVTHRYLTEDFESIHSDHAYRSYYGAFDTWERLAETRGVDGNYDRYVSEWNVWARHTSETGLRSASSMLALVTEMVKNGIDSASVWAVQQANNQNLTASSGLPWTRWQGLSVNGAMFEFLKEGVVGRRLVQSESIAALEARSDSFDVEAFTANDQSDSYIYISSRSNQVQTFTIDVDTLMRGVRVTSVAILGVDGSNNPTDPNAVPIVRYSMSDTMNENGEITIRLAPWEVGRIYITTNQYRVMYNGTEDNDRISMNKHANFSRGMEGDDTLMAGAGDDRVFSGEGDDLIFAGSGNDDVYGGSGSDRMMGRNGDDLIDGGWGQDTLRGGSGRDTISGGDGSDRIAGGAGRDFIDGGNNSDEMYGGRGQDTINGNQGNDKYYGGAGADTFIYTGNWDTILDFDSAEGDIIKISRDLLPNGANLEEFLRESAVYRNDMLIIDFGSGNRLAVVGAEQGSFVEDFVFVF